MARGYHRNYHSVACGNGAASGLSARSRKLGCSVMVNCEHFGVAGSAHLSTVVRVVWTGLTKIRVHWGSDPHGPALWSWTSLRRQRADGAGAAGIQPHSRGAVAPHTTHIHQPVDVCWAKALETWYSWYLRKPPEEAAVTRRPLRLGAVRGRRMDDGDSGVCFAFAASGLVGVATRLSGCQAS
jgi:hypothetical protein